MSSRSRMSEDVWLAERPRLLSLAYRILGSWHDAEDVVSQVWLRSADRTDVANAPAWLTTVTTRLAIDQGRRLKALREEYIGPWLPEPVATELLPEESAVQRESLHLGLLRLMEELSPEDRAVVVLREAFDVPYAEIAERVGKSLQACRQVVSRAKQRLPRVTHAPERDERLMAALVTALAAGDMAAAVELLSEGCVLWTDSGGATKAARRPVIGADKVARFLIGVSAAVPGSSADPVNVNGAPAFRLEWPGGTRIVVLEHDGENISGMQIHSNPHKLEFAL